MTVAIYIRVSTEEQVKEGFSISAQREKLTAYCKSQDWNDFKFYIDEGISAKSTDRPQLKTMLEHINQGIINTVLVYRLDRLTRSVQDLYVLLDEFQRNSCTFKSATEIFDTTTAMGRMFITIVAALAQWERENLGERVRMGQIEKARQGQYSAKAPFGYYKNDNRLVKDPNESQVVLNIIRLVKEGCTIRKIAHHLDDTYPPIRGYKWHIRTILDILHNPALYGATRWKDEIIEGTHFGIVTKEEFENLQKLLHDRQNFKKRETYSIFIFQMKIECPTCGSRLTSERSKYKRKRDNAIVESNHYRCQVCTLNKRKSIGISEKKFEKAFLEYLKNEGFNFQPNEVEKHDDNQADLLKRIKQVEQQRAKYQKAWANGWVTDEEFSQHMSDTMKELKLLQDELKEANGFKHNVNVYEPEVIRDIVKNLNENWQFLTPKEKRELVQSFVEKIQFTISEERKALVSLVSFY
ncbi:recombinase family protein [Bacillus sp. RO2]|uniref:recombinase family protein n=1 Tax=Bacillus sp. RO2 TaxID=2723913 RepID=UPI00145CD6EE|nr:recombinase family protein [Bacillus sp. RO2]NMH72822.1 recombinase family protein [Bacillus sp. RO2]